MKIVFFVFTSIIFGVGCATPAKKVKEPVEASNSAKPQLDNWADDYYYQTRFIVKNPLLVESYNEIIKACKSGDIYFTKDYQDKVGYKIAFKELPIHLESKGGFKKVVFITKGVCRELSLFRSAKLKGEGQIRKSIKSAELIYIYNHGTFLKQIIFETPYSDVDFLVE